MPAFAIVEAFANLVPAQPAYRYIFCVAQGWSSDQGCGAVPGRSTGGPPWAGEIPLILMTAAYLGVILFLTSRRSRVTRSTLAIGAGVPRHPAGERPARVIAGSSATRGPAVP